MPCFDIDAVLKAEDSNIENLVEISKLPPENVSRRGFLLCANCGREKTLLKNSSQRDLKRWEIFSPEDIESFFQAKSLCHCSIGNDGVRKSEGSKPRKKGKSDFLKSDQNNSKDFIAHNIRTCNTYRLRENNPNQNINQFVHYKESKEYIKKYRLGKLEKMEHSSYQLDQSNFNEEVYRSLSNSLTTLMGNVNLVDGQIATTLTDSTKASKSDMKMRDIKLRSNLNIGPFVDLPVNDYLKSQTAKEIDFCMKCGDCLKEQDFLPLSNGLPLEEKFSNRANSNGKVEEKKVKKLLKRTSDHRPRLIIEKPVSEANRTDIEQPCSNDLQPFCQQMPIQKNSLIEKRSTFKKDEWRGHPSSTKPRFSEGGLARIQDDNRRNRSGSRKPLEHADFFGCYGEKYHLLKESS